MVYIFCQTLYLYCSPEIAYELQWETKKVPEILLEEWIDCMERYLDESAVLRFKEFCKLTIYK
jgi:hypothetical protein